MTYADKILQDGKEPVFSEPWEAQAFSLVAGLLEGGTIEREEWSQALGAAIRAAKESGDPDLGDSYYRHCLQALESLLVNKGVIDAATITRRMDDWRQAYLSTPHGQPVELITKRGN